MESDIPSPELFPIHYLDELEFFPGDYVVDAKGRFMYTPKKANHVHNLRIPADHSNGEFVYLWIT